MKSRILKVAAVIAVVGILMIFFANTQQSLYGQVMRAFDEARSVYAVGYRLADGQMLRSGEIWYVKDVGLRMKSIWKGKTREKLDNGEYQWEYTEGDRFAVQAKSDGSLQLPREFREPARYLEKSERAPQADENVDGFPCQCYVSVHTFDSGTTVKSMMWIDEQMRFRKYEEKELQEGGWVTTETATVSYDIDINEDMFVADFGPEVLVIKPSDILDKKFSLEDVIAERECLGLTVAIHDISRNGKYLFITSSIRPTETSRQQLSAYERAGHKPNSQYGNLSLSHWWTRNDDGSMVEHIYGMDRLGTFSMNGITVNWHAMLPKGQWPGLNEELKLCGYVYTDNNLRRLREEQGLGVTMNFRPIVTLDLPDKDVDVEQIAGDIYQTAKLAMPFYTHDAMFEPRPNELSPEEFAAEVERKLVGLRPMKELWDEVGSQITLEVMDPDGKPVSGAEVGLGMRSSNGNRLVTGEDGKAIVIGEEMFSPLDSRNAWSSVYAVHQGRQLAAITEIGAEHFGKMVRVELQPACMVRAKFASADLQALAKKLGPVTSYLWYDGDGKSGKRIVHRLDVLSSRDKERFEAILVPGYYEISCQSKTDAKDWTQGNKMFEVPAGKTDLDLGNIELRLGK